VNFLANTAMSRLVNSRKGVSSRRLRQESPDLRHYWRPNWLWPGSYFAGSASGAPISVLCQYIDQQDRSGLTSSYPSAFTTDLKASALADI